MIRASAEDWSSALGWVSIACWIVVYTPQLYENYVLKSGEGVSILFIIIWLLGDVFNLAGALMANLLPTVIILACYYLLCDITILAQIYYYRWTHPVRKIIPGVAVVNDDGEETPLLREHVAEMPKHSTRRQVLNYGLASVFVVAVGLIAWRLDSGTPKNRDGKVVLEWKSQVIGWASAALYLGSRIPQILKNFETKCEGLSPAMFFFTIAGNTTYAVSILVSVNEWRDFVANASWLAGSLLTIFLDLFVLGQCFHYRRAQPIILTNGRTGELAEEGVGR